MSASAPGSIGIVGLGYVGLPLAWAFGCKRETVGFDIDVERVAALRAGHDATGEVGREALQESRSLKFAADAAALGACEFIVVAVPTPVDDARRPDFGPLLAACAAIGPVLRAGATVIFESTVYPGATEEVCVPALEAASGKRWKRDFFVGYSPERINPGDAQHTLSKIVKVVSGDTPQTLERVAGLYALVVEAGVHRAPSIRVAEAAKVIENAQRDLNIAFMNELAIIFHRMGIDTREVLEAARTKWNFLPFTPGLVGGHCIGVDPYYLTHQAERHGHHAEVILAGRRINDGMGKYIAEQTVKCLVARKRPVNGARVTVLGLTFKEDCGDVRNSKVVDVVRELEAYGAIVQVHDPLALPQAAQAEYGITLAPREQLGRCDALVLAVAHREFVAHPADALLDLVAEGGCVIDVKSVLDREAVRARGLTLWRL